MTGIATECIMHANAEGPVTVARRRSRADDGIGRSDGLGDLKMAGHAAGTTTPAAEVEGDLTTTLTSALTLVEGALDEVGDTARVTGADDATLTGVGEAGRLITGMVLTPWGGEPTKSAPEDVLALATLWGRLPLIGCGALVMGEPLRVFLRLLHESLRCTSWTAFCSSSGSEKYGCRVRSTTRTSEKSGR